MAFWKIKSGHVTGVRTALEYTGENGHLFYSQDDNVLRISDGHTLGGIPINGGGTIISVTPPQNPIDGTLWYDPTSGRLYVWFEGTWVDANPQTSAAVTSIIAGTGISINTSTGAVTISATGGVDDDSMYLTSSTVNTYTIAKNPFDQSLNTTDTPSFSGLLPTSTSTYIGRIDRPFKDIYLQSGSINIANANNTLASLLVSNTDGFLQLDGGGFRIQYLGSPIFTVAAITGQIYSEAKTIIANATNAVSTTTGALQVAGGAGIQQDLWVGGGVYTSYIGSDIGDITVQADTTGTVQILGGNFQVHTTANPNPVFSVDTAGQVKILAPTFDSNTGALSIIGSVDGAFVSPTNTGAMIHVTGQPGTVSRIYNDAAGNYSLFVGRRYNGTATNPQPVLAGDSIVRFGGTAYNDGGSGSGFAQAGNGRMEIVATENHTPTANGAQLQFWTIATGTSTFAAVPDIRIDSHGLTFRDGTKQDTAAIPQTLFGTPNGVATLDNSGKVFTSQLPSGAVVFKGSWDANTNTPTLSENQMGALAGWEYVTSTTGTQTISTLSGAVTFYPGDYVIYDGVSWNKIPGVVSVIAFNGRTGSVTLSNTDVTTALGYTPYNATNPSNYITLAQVPTSVTSFNGRQNTVSLTTNDVTNVLTTATITNNMLAGSISNDKLAHSSVTVGSQLFSLGDTVYTLTNLITVSATAITATNFTGNLAGNATSATKLQVAHTINGVAFDGTADITVTAGYATTASNVVNAVTSITTGTGIRVSASTGTVQISFANDGGYITSSALTGYATQSYVTTRGYITSSTISVTTGSAVSGGALAYSTTTGVFTFNPATVYTLTTATSSTLGGVKIGSGLTAAGDGTISVTTSSAQTVSTWVPTLTATGGGSFTYSTQLGNYVKSGRQVSLYFTIVITGASGVSGTVAVSGFPYPSESTSGSQGGGALDNYSFSLLPTHVTGIVPSNSSQMDLYWHDRSGSSNTMGLMTTGNLGTSATLTGRITYISAS